MKKQLVKTEFISQQTYVNISLKTKGTWTLERDETVTKPVGNVLLPLALA